MRATVAADIGRGAAPGIWAEVAGFTRVRAMPSILNQLRGVARPRFEG